MSSAVTTSAASATATSTDTNLISVIEGAVVQATTTAKATSSSSSSTSSASNATSTSDSNADVKSSSSSSTSSSSDTSTSTKSNSSSSSSSTSKDSSTTSASQTSQSSSSSSSSKSAATSSGSAASLTSASQLTSATQGVVLLTTTANGQPATLTSQVLAPTSASQPSATAAASENVVQEFFKNKGAVAGVFTVVGVVSFFLIFALILKIVRYRLNRSSEKELDEQFERAATPMFGPGKEDDGLSVMGGRASDPEKFGAGYGTGYGDTTAAATYGSTARAVQPAFYSPNSEGGPRRYPSRTGQPFEDYRPESRGSARSYGSLNQPPMNAFAYQNAPYQRGGAPAFPPATFASNYGEYRNPSPAPSTQSWQSRNQGPFNRSGTPSSLTPAGRESPGPTIPRNAVYPLGARPDSPAVLGRYSPRNSSQLAGGSQGAYISRLPSTRLQTGGLSVQANSREPPSPNAGPLPNPFDQRD